MIRIACLLVLMTATAIAAPPARVLVADPDPALAKAIEKALAPWKITVVVDATTPEGEAPARAEAMDAQFVVWRSGTELVVFDRAGGTSERRATRPGALDPVTAAAAALTVKTMLRLPPLVEESDAERSNARRTSARATTATAGPELRLQVAAGARIAPGSESGLGGRGLLALLVRPSPAYGLRLGVAGDLGTSSTVENSGFKGTWGNWSVLAVASWSWALGHLEVAPAIGAGIFHSHLDGAVGSKARAEADVLPLVRAGIGARWPVGRWSVGMSFDADLVPGAPTYMKEQGMKNSNAVFEVPNFMGTLAVFAAADFGR